MKNKIEKFISAVLVIFLICYCIDIKISAEPIVEYISDDQFILGSYQISSLIGNDQKLSFKEPDINSTNPLEYELFPNGSPKPDDIEQGKSRICYLLAALSSIVETHPELIKEAITDNGDGTVTVKIYDLNTAKIRLIKVQKTIPNLPRCCKILGKECLWVHMLIKGLIAVNLDQHACCKISPTKKYAAIENGAVAPALKMLTGRNVTEYKDFSIFKMGEEKLFNVIKEALRDKKILTCDFNHNRFVATIHGFLPLGCSDRGLVYGHCYSIVGAYEDSLGQKWIKVRNPWHGFSIFYDSLNNRCVEPNDNISEGYFSLKIKDFYKACGSLQVVDDTTLNPMRLFDKIKEKAYTVPSRLAIITLSFVLTEYGFAKSNSIKLDTNTRLLLYPLLSIATNLIFW